MHPSSYLCNSILSKAKPVSACRMPKPVAICYADISDIFAFLWSLLLNLITVIQKVGG